MKERLTIAMIALVVCVAAGEESAPTLARLLMEDDLHDAAAVEYRRLALDATEPDASAGYDWAAAYEYWRAEKPELAARQLDASDERSSAFLTQSQLLRAEIARAGSQPGEIAFCLESVLRSHTDIPTRLFVSRRLARARLAQRDSSAAREALSLFPRENAEALRAVDNYSNGRDRVPWVGGALGLIPGLGYAYSAEYGNALRSFLINALFGYGLIDTSRDEEWGAFSVIAFFELTWYTGSVYGGVDSAHRYNRNRLDGCAQAIDGHTSFLPDWGAIPIVRLTFQF